MARRDQATRRGESPPDDAVWGDYVRSIRPLRGRARPNPNSPSVPRSEEGGGKGQGEVGATQARGSRSGSEPRNRPDDSSSTPAGRGPSPPLPGPLRPPLHSGARRGGARPLAIGDAPARVDAASWNRLRSGRFAPERTLDLHGRTAHAAFHALEGFLHRAQADRLRCVEIITGRGEGGSGVLRRELPIWLNLDALRPLVLGAAYPHPANSGAVRLLLRRPR